MYQSVWCIYLPPPINSGLFDGRGYVFFMGGSLAFQIVLLYVINQYWINELSIVWIITLIF